MKLYELIISKRTHREFERRSVSRDLLECSVNAARLAPQAGNRQPLKFVVVDDDELCGKMFSMVRFAGNLPDWNPSFEKRPPAYIVVIVKKEYQKPPWIPYDIAYASHNICLTAWEKGVSSCLMLSFKKGEVEKLLNIPSDYDAGLVIAMGYPAHGSVVEEMKGDDFKYRRDEEGNFHVPKRNLKDVLSYNKFAPGE